MENRKHTFLFRNGLSIVFLLLMIFSVMGQIFTGWKEHNEFLNSYYQQPQTLGRYLHSGHFLEAIFENWESEFFQMALFVALTIFLRQQGSSESKKCDEPPIDKTELIAKENSPWSVKKGGFYLWFYKNSLTIVLFLLFIFSFIMHWYGSWLDFSEKQLLEQKPAENFCNFIYNKKLWFESFQNWQSEFLSIFAIIFLSIYLRQIGSSQSKKVNDPHYKTGED
ncbi:MAG: DUF6766 family protein [Bacteroidia bacterium]